MRTGIITKTLDCRFKALLETFGWRTHIYATAQALNPGGEPTPILDLNALFNEGFGSAYHYSVQVISSTKA